MSINLVMGADISEKGGVFVEELIDDSDVTSYRKSVIMFFGTSKLVIFEKIVVRIFGKQRDSLLGF